MSAAKRERFVSVWPRIQAELVQYLQDHHMPPDVTSWYERNLQYNVPGGKLMRGMAVVDVVEIMRGGASPWDEEEYFKVALLGWCIEFGQAFALIADDIMDSSVTRRDQLCWYRVEKPEKVGMIAVNDAHMLESAIYFLLKRYFRKYSFYAVLVDVFHVTSFLTEMGQLADLVIAPQDEVDFSRFSLQKHHLVSAYKSGYFSFYLPVVVAMIYVGVPIPNEIPTLARTPCFDGNIPTPTTTTTSDFPAISSPYHTVLDISLALGVYGQVQNDYLDCFGVNIGKIGTDILDNKCSWVICTALKLANPEQLAVLSANYGRKSAVAEAKCKAIFEELDIRYQYTEYEKHAFNYISEMIDAIDESWGSVTMKRDIFGGFLNKLYKRQK